MVDGLLVDAVPLSGLAPPDRTGRYHPLLRFDDFWQITGENAATRWLRGSRCSAGTCLNSSSIRRWRGRS